MKFKKLITINWGVVQDGEYPFGDLTAITGETGVGKSSFGDAIQTIMGAALKNIIVYNAGQDEAQNKKRGKEYRTLEGYISGEDQFRFARPKGCTGVVALTFQSSENETKRLFTAILNTSVSFEMQKGNKVPRIDELRFFIVKDSEVYIDDFTGDGGILYSYSKLHSRLSAKYGKNRVIEYRGKEDFLNGLYGHLWGRETASSIYSKRAAKAFCNFINAKPVDDINSFVRNEFLEPKNMKDQVLNLSEALRSLDRAKQEARDVEDGLRLVTRVIGDSGSLIKKWYESKEEHFTYSLYSLKVQEKKIRDKEKEFTKAETDIKQYEKDIKRLKGEIDATDENIRLLEAKMGEDKDFKKYKSIKESLEKNKATFNSLKGTFLIKRINELAQLRNQTINALEHDELVNGTKELFDDIHSILNEISEHFFFQYFSSTGIDDEGMHSQLETLDDSLIAYEYTLEKLHSSAEFVKIKKTLGEMAEKNTALRVDFEKRKKDIRDEIRNLEEDIVYLAEDKRRAFEILKESMPNVSLGMLYEYVDIKAEHAEWRESIEGFIGNNRYAIVIDSTHEIDALNVVRDNNLNLKIIQGTKVAEDIRKLGKTVKGDSIVNLLDFTHPTAEAYFISTYKNVMAVEDPDKLKIIRSGIMKDCRAASGNTMFSCRLNIQRYVFGSEGRKQTLENLIEEEEKIKELSDNAESARGILKRSMDLFQNISTEFKTMVSNKTHHDNMFTAFKEYRLNKTTLSLMDITSLEKIQEDIKRYKRGKETLENRRDGIVGNSAIQEKMIRDRAEIEMSQKKELERRADSYIKILEQYQAIYQAYNEGRTHSIQIHIDTIKEKIKNVKLDIPKPLEAVVINEWSTFIQHYYSRELADSPKIQINLDFSHKVLKDNIEIFIDLMILKKKFTEEKDLLEHAQTFIYKQKIEEANEKFESTFINDFCNSIYVHIREGEGSILELNSALKKHSFGSDRFAVSTLDPDPELKEYKKYFKSIHELKDIASGDSLLSAIYSDEYKDMTKKLTELIKDSDKRGAEIERLSDYRNYYNYDILQTTGEKEISLSRNGKMSGGQGETSYYVIRSINLHAALKAKDIGGSALEAVFMDESFSKTNEKRAKEILEYLNSTMGFQIVFAMPTKHIGAFLNLDLDGYHFTKIPLLEKTNGELDYKVWVQRRKLNGNEIKNLYEREDHKIKEEIKKEAEEIFG